MLRIEIIKLFDKITDKYETSQTSVIHERSGSICDDVIALKIEATKYRQELLDLIEQMTD